MREIRQETMRKEQLFSAQEARRSPPKPTDQPRAGPTPEAFPDDEVMMLSGDRGVSPVSTLDGQQVGNGEASRLKRKDEDLICQVCQVCLLAAKRRSGAHCSRPSVYDILERSAPWLASSSA